MTGWLFALGSALFYGTSDFVGGLASRRAHYVVVALLGQFAGLVVAVVAGLALVAQRDDERLVVGRLPDVDLVILAYGHVGAEDLDALGLQGCTHGCWGSLRPRTP